MENLNGTARIMVVDDDGAVRAAMSNLLSSVDYEVETFKSSADFMTSSAPGSANCIILDVRLPMVSGFDLKEALSAAEIKAPVIFITGYGDIPMSVRAMKAGAVDFLAKPFRDQDLLDAVAVAVQSDRQRREREQVSEAFSTRFENLSLREQQVMALATSGMMNKEIAFKLGLSLITVKIHRGKVMRKMEVESFADLVRAAELIGRDRLPG